MHQSSAPSGPPGNVVGLALLFEGALVAVACALGWFMATPPWMRLGVGWENLAWGLAATAPMLVGLLVLRQVHRGPLGRLNRVVDELLVPLFGGCTILQLAAVSLVAGVGEELLFRGVVQPHLIGWFGTAVGLAVTSAVFGLVHAITVAYAVVAAVVGAYLGWLALATDGLLAPMLAHALYDFAALVYLTRASTKASESAAGEQVG